MLDHARTKADTIRDLCRQGLSTSEVIAATGFNRQYVASVACSYRRYGSPSNIRASRPPTTRTACLCLTTTVWALLEPHAERRGLSVSRLVSQLARCAARGDLVDAILDDR